MSFLGPVLAAVAVTIVMGLLSRSAQGPPRATSDGALELRFPIPMLVIGILSIAIAVALSVVLPSVEGVENRGWVIGLTSGFAALGALIVVLQRRVRVVYDHDTISAVGLTKVRELNWQQIESVRYSAVAGEIVVAGNDMRVRAGRMMVGFPTFAAELKARLGDEMTREALAAVDAHR